MAATLAREDLEFLRQVQAWGMDGATQSEISARLGINNAQLRYRLNRLGFEPTGLIDLRTCLGGVRLVDLLARGELTATEDPTPAEKVTA